MSRLSRRSFAALAGGAILASGTPARTADLAGVTLRVGDQTGAVRAKLEAAKVLDALPYKIDWSVYAAAVNLHEALKADAIDIGSAANSPTVSAIAGGSPIEVVAAWTDGGRGTSILVPKDSPIRTLADLKGNTISPTTRGSVAHYLLLGALKQAGLTAHDVKIAFLTPVDASAAFQAGSIDAWVTWNVYRARTEGVLGARRLLDGTGINSGLGVLSATRKALADPLKTAAIADYADRVQRGYDWRSPIGSPGSTSTPHFPNRTGQSSSGSMTTKPHSAACRPMMPWSPNCRRPTATGSRPACSPASATWRRSSIAISRSAEQCRSREHGRDGGPGPFAWPGPGDQPGAHPGPGP